MSEIPQSANQSLSNLHSEELVEFPLVTVNILSFNRKEELRHTLTKVYEQDYKNIEVIVVDNASSDGSAEMVEQEFPSVILIKLQKNIGIAGWNRGFEIAKGEFVLVLDDDSYPEEGAIIDGVKLIFYETDLAVVGFTIFNQQLGLIENDEHKQMPGDPVIDANGFIGCGALIRRSIFLKLGGYDENIFLYFNELELSIRLINNNYKILYLSTSRIIHMYSWNNRDSTQDKKYSINRRRYSNGFVSYFIYLYKNFSLYNRVRFITKLILSNLYVAFRLSYLRDFFISLKFIFGIYLSHSLCNNPVKKKVQERFNFGNMKFMHINIYK